MIRYGGMTPNDLDGQNQYIHFSYDLTADGRPRRVKVTEHAMQPGARYNARGKFPKEVRFRPAIVDGHPVHRSRKVKRWVEEHKKQIRLVQLPGYSPDLNPIEQVT